MKILNSKIHGFLDYFVVATLVAIPSLLNFTDLVSVMTFSLAAIHFLLAILTDFELGLLKKVSLKIHGVIELIVAISLFAFGLLFPFPMLVEQIFYEIFAVVIFATWFITDYSWKRQSA